MHTVTGLVRRLLGLLAALVLTAGLVATDAAQAAATAMVGSAGGCNPYVDGTVIPVPCASGSASAGNGGPAGGTSSAAVNNSCTTIVLGAAEAQSLGLAPPASNDQSWALLQCPGSAAGPAARDVLVNSATRVPSVTPQQLLVSALGELRLPHLGPSTAPPRGHDGLVGLPEWFWVAADGWHARTVTVTAGPVWATVTATPIGLAFEPGGGLGPVSCSGPGTAYNPHVSVTAQHTGCSYTYLRPSTGQPGNAYQASVTVTWRVSWTGSGGDGGVLDAALPVPVDFTLPVAQGEALVTSP